MSYPGPGAQPTALFVDGAPVGAGNPLPVSGGGGSLGTVDQGTAGSAPAAWFTRDEAARTSLASIDGKLRDPVGVSGVFASISSTENAWILLRNRAEFGGTVNQRQLLPLISNLTVETNARIVRARYVLNPTLSATVNWQYVNQSTSSVEFATPTGITITGGTQVGAFAAATNQTLPLDTLDLRLEPGDVLAVALQTASSTATADVSLNWHEE